MSTRFRALALMLLLLWQALSSLALARLDGPRDALAHALVHGQAVDHHHHEQDAALQLDVDLSADGHQHVHDGLQVQAVPPARWLHLAARQAVAPPPRMVARAGPPVFLEGPLRPPRPLA
jgi:hypothetical protein